MKKKWIIFNLILIGISTILIGCQIKEPTKEEVYLEFQKMITSIESYTCDAEVEVHGNKNPQKYSFIHTYNKPENYKLEVVSPSHLKGKTIEYQKDKIIVTNPEIKDKVELPNIGDNNQYMFIGDFIKNYLQSESVEIQLAKDYLVLQTHIPGEREYFDKQVLYVNKDTKKPDKMEILDSQGKLRFSIKYKSFEYKK